MREGYKMTELGEIPEDWEVVYLDKHINLLSGFPFKSEDFSETSNGTKLLRGVNITVGKLRWDSKIDRYWDQEFSEFEKYSAKADDLVISMDGSLVGRNYGRVRKEDLPLLLVQRVACIRAKQSLILEYLSQIVGSPIFINYVDAVKTSSGIPHISAKNIKEFKISLPPLQEQQKIAQILSTVDEKIEVIDAQITQTRELKKGLMQKLLTRGIGHTKFKESVLGEIPESWEVDVMENISEITSSKRIHQSEYVETGIPFYRGKEISQKSRSTVMNDLVFITENKFIELSSKFGAPVEGDVLITAVGTIGSIYLVGPNERFYFKDGNLMWLRKISSKLNRSFFFHYLTSFSFQQLIDVVSGGSSQKALTIVKFKSLPVVVPSLDEQIKIAEVLSVITEKLDLLNKRKEIYQQLKKGLMQQLLTGKVRVVQAELQNA